MKDRQQKTLEEQLEDARREYREATRKSDTAWYNGDSKAHDHLSKKRDEASGTIVHIKNLIGM
jgi:hypothetical protein